MRPDPANPASQDFRDQVAEQLDAFLEAKRTQLVGVSPALAELTRVAADFVSGGKRLRPAFAYWGYVAACGSEEVPQEIWPAVSAFELLHAGVLMHDDVLDEADTRRGNPTVHRQFEAWHRASQGAGDPAQFGRAMAVVLGDELIVWSDELVSDSGLETAAWHRAGRYWHLVRTEVNTGQVLDLWAQYRVGSDAGNDPERVAAKVLEEKTSRYTVQRPVQFGAAAAGACEATLEALGHFGLALGRAFQLRDDLLGVFAATDQTGKPEAGDLVEGKRTMLLAKALELLDAPRRAQLEGLVGKPMTTDQIMTARDLVTSSGAADFIEQLIGDDYASALHALSQAELSDPGRIALTELARQCVERQF